MEDAGRGRGGALVLLGEPGIGKTALLGAARHMARDMPVLEAAGIHAERDLPGGVLGRLLRPVLDRVDAVPAPQRDALRGALALGPRLADPDPLAVATGALSLLEEVSRRRPVLVLVDDLQWVDAPSAEILLFCARRALTSAGPALVIAGRADPLGLARSVPSLEIGPLDEDDALALLCDASIGIGLVGPVARALLRSAAGNPLALVELPGLLTPTQREGGEPVPDPLPPGPAVVRAFREVVEALPAGARGAALLVACGSHDDLATVVPALDRLGLGVRDLEDAESGGVLAIEGGRVRFRHPLLAGVVVRLAEPRERRRAHAALADALDPARDPERWVGHRAAAVIGPDETVAAALADVAREAGERADHHGAAQRYLRAAELSAGVDARAERLVLAAQAAFAAGRASWAADLGRDALALRPSEALATRAALAVGEAMVTAGDLRETARFLARSARRTSDADARARMLAIASFAKVMRGDTDAALAQARLAISTSAEAGTPAARLRAWAAMSVAAVLTGDARLVRRMRPRMEADVALVRPDPPLTVSLGTIALGLAWAEEWEAGRRMIHRVVKELRRAGLSGALAVPLSHSAWIDLRSADWAGARAKCDEAIALGEESGLVVATAFTMAYRAILHAGCGRDPDCRVDAVRARNLAAGMGASAVDVHVAYALALLEMGAGEPAQARDHLAPLAGRERGYGIGEPFVVPWRALLVEALARLGDTDGAMRHLAVLAAEADRSGGPAARALAARCRGLLDRGPAWERHFREALALHARGPVAFEEARTALLYGERLRRDRRRADARDHLNAALTVFTRLEARCWADRARQELDASGLRARRGPLTEELTPRELQVAATVASGHTNREAAARLYLSEKTVERHLGSVYRKLGLRSRSQLARWFASGEQAGEQAAEQA